LGGDPGEDPRHSGGSNFSRLAWEHLCVPSEELKEVYREKKVWAFLLRLPVPDKCKTMDGAKLMETLNTVMVTSNETRVKPLLILNKSFYRCLTEIVSLFSNK